MTSQKKITAVKGMCDVLPPASKIWTEVESTARRVFAAYGYHEIRTPIVESTDLFIRGVGKTSAIVEKEMYAFTDKGEDNLSLRPEGTASVVRAYIESGACITEPIARYYYMGPMFRRERPQKGRQRQFYQIGVELLGIDSPHSDAEVMAMFEHFFSELKLKDLKLEINSIGCAECRPEFNKMLLEFLKKNSSELCEDCLRRMEKNPLRTLDCKQESCRRILSEAPMITEFLCEKCGEHFAAVKKGLTLVGVKYELNPKIVRGLDYYMRTAFEFTTQKLGSQNAVAAGGRYDGLVKALGGPEIAGVGVALGMERLVLLLEEMKIEPKREDVVFFAALGDKARDAVMPIIQMLRKDGICVEWDYAARSLKAQMRRADKVQAETVVIIGDSEIEKDIAIVKDMRAGTQHEVRIKDLPMHFVQIGG